MTDLLRQALVALERLPTEVQDDLARAPLAYVRDADSDGAEPEDIDPDHLDAVLDGMAQAERGEFAVGDACDVVRAAFDRPRS